MAKRRKLEAPSSDDLNRIEAEFRRETTDRDTLGPGRAVAPIAQVAAESAAQAPVTSTEARAEQARLQSEADRLHRAEAEGLLMAELPLADIEADALVRDRSVLDEAEMDELRLSIAAHGLRLPIEVFDLAEPEQDGPRYGLVSGYRRLLATRALLDLTGQDRYQTIRAVIRPRQQADAAFVAMVEENEVRAELSQFERGRIAVIAAQQGAFVNVEEAVNRLFATASKAKRSKVRSFAMIFEELGDMLIFPENLSEKRGLRLAGALRHGAEPLLREALATGQGTDPDAEWAQIEAVIDRTEAGPRHVQRGGRPRKPAPVLGWRNAEVMETSAGITIRRSSDDQGYILRFEGRGIDSELMDSLVCEIRALLERP